ncbi:hypothetical protein PIB30_000877 [Stylosanthes scabra]|uniref:Uncharacterized protein n=1 Tax=Stylosanthes scabra TaxID=79078 RepID=A0ABU6R2D9_9FABA|nr:hypothetical protein [Stylosanthes scabra]
MYMAKNGNNMRHSIAIMLVMGIIIVCSGSGIAEASNVIFEGNWVSSSDHDVSSSLEKCTEYCKVHYHFNQDRIKTCTMTCIVDECRRLEPTDPKKYRNCVEDLYAKYVVNE